MRFLTLFLGCAFAIASGPIRADDADQRVAALERQLHYRQGVVELNGGFAELAVPKSFRYLGPDDAQKVLVEGWGNPPGSKTLGMLVPATTRPLSEEGWAVVITYDDDGYVTDSDAEEIDYSDLLSTMQKATEKENEKRAKDGYEAVHLVGWAEPPSYDKASHKLYWAKDLQFGDGANHTLNYNIRVLGRKGVLVLNAVAGMDQLTSVKHDMQKVLGFVEFTDGHRYADYKPGIDKAAGYGLAALVAGGIAAKTGLLKGLLAGILAFKKLIVVGVAGIGSYFARLFKRKKLSPYEP